VLLRTYTDAREDAMWEALFEASRLLLAEATHGGYPSARTATIRGFRRTYRPPLPHSQQVCPERLPVRVLDHPPGAQCLRQRLSNAGRIRQVGRSEPDARLAELSVGPLVAHNGAERIARQVVLQQVEADFDPLPFDDRAARAFGRVAASLHSASRTVRARSYGAMIAAIAVAHGLQLYTANDAPLADE